MAKLAKCLNHSFSGPSVPQWTREGGEGRNLAKLIHIPLHLHPFIHSSGQKWGWMGQGARDPQERMPSCLRRCCGQIPGEWAETRRKNNNLREGRDPGDHSGVVAKFLGSVVPWPRGMRVVIVVGRSGRRRRSISRSGTAVPWGIIHPPGGGGCFSSPSFFHSFLRICPSHPPPTRSPRMGAAVPFPFSLSLSLFSFIFSHFTLLATTRGRRGPIDEAEEEGQVSPVNG